MHLQQPSELKLKVLNSSLTDCFFLSPKPPIWVAWGKLYGNHENGGLELNKLTRIWPNLTDRLARTLTESHPWAYQLTCQGGQLSPPPPTPKTKLVQFYTIKCIWENWYILDHSIFYLWNSNVFSVYLTLTICSLLWKLLYEWKLKNWHISDHGDFLIGNKFLNINTSFESYIIKFSTNIDTFETIAFCYFLDKFLTILLNHKNWFLKTLTHFRP